jgi:hypothetical protein
MAKRGKSVRCPKCLEVFPLIPHDEDKSSEESSPHAEEVAPHSSEKSSLAVSTAHSPSLTTENHPDDSLRLAQVAMGTAAVVLLLSQLPYGRPVAVLVALLGSIVVAFGALGLEKRAWLGWVGVVINVFVFLILIAFPGTLGIAGWWPDLGSNAGATGGDGNPKGEWIDAGDAAWQQGGVRVGVTFATIGSDPSSNARSGTKERYLWIGLKLTNVGAGNELEFLGWKSLGEDGPVLSTPEGMLIATKQYAGPKGKTIVQQGRVVECMLAFDVPPSGQDLLLDLPTRPFGDTTLIRLRIPHNLIGKQ